MSAGPPLAGLRVVTLAESYPGPFATMVLADLGADVVMVERPGGDPTRPATAHFEALNRHKRSVTLDLKTETGGARLHDLLATADVLVEGFRPGVLARLGFPPAMLRERYPDLVLISMSAYGQTGPDAGHAAHDLSVQGRAGALDLDLADAGAGADPTAGTPTADLAAALYATVGALAALVARGRGAGGTHVDVAMLDCLVAWRTATVGPVLNGEPPIQYPPLEPAYGVFTGSDGTRLTISIAGEDRQWATVCRELGLDDLAGLGVAARAARVDELRTVLATAIGRRKSDELVRTLADAGVSCALVRTDADLADDPHLTARGMFVDIGGGRRAVRQPLVFDGWTTGPRDPAPRLGQ